MQLQEAWSKNFSMLNLFQIHIQTNTNTNSEDASKCYSGLGYDTCLRCCCMHKQQRHVGAFTGYIIAFLLPCLYLMSAENADSFQACYEGIWGLLCVSAFRDDMLPSCKFTAQAHCQIHNRGEGERECSKGGGTQEEQMCINCYLEQGLSKMDIAKDSSPLGNWFVTDAFWRSVSLLGLILGKRFFVCLQEAW